MSFSNSSSNSQSTGSGSSFIPDYPQSAFLQMIASEANNYANAAYGRYDSTFQPLENALISDSNKFQSPGYLSGVAGAASSGAAQAGEAQRTNSLRDLQAFGIDPSGGRYAELDKAERGRTAATQAGAAQEAMRQTQQAGRDMRIQALGIGQKNLDRAVQQQQIASNLKYPPLGNAQQSQSTTTQRSSTTPSNNSSGNKNNPSQSRNPDQGANKGSGTGQNQPANNGTSSGGAAIGHPPGISPGNNGRPNGDGTFGSPVNGTAFDNFSQNNDYINGGQNDPFAYIYGGYNTGGDYYNPGADNPQYGSNANPFQPYDPNNINPTQGDPNNPWGDNSTALNNQNMGGWPDSTTSGGGGAFNTYGQNVNDTSGGGGGGGSGEYTGPGSTAFSRAQDQSQWDQLAQETGQPSTQQLNDNYNNLSQNVQDFLGTNNPLGDYNPTTDYSQGTDQSGTYNASNDVMQTSQTQDYASGSDWYQADNSDGGGYAQGGAIDLQGGGQAPEAASPSMGQQTDDIHANVNADEFVIPKDVALWKGQEFFQKLIDQSRKARLTAPAQGSSGQGQPQPQPAMG